MEQSIGIHELATLLGGQLADPQCENRLMTGIASIGEAGPSDVTFLGNSKYLPSLRASHAGVVLVSPEFSEQVPPVVIQVENPSVAFARLVELFAPKPVTYVSGIHPSAVVGEGVWLGADVCIEPNAVVQPGASIGARTVIGAGCVVGHGVKIGEDTFLHPRVVIAERCIIGSRVILQSGVIVGSDGFGFEQVKGRHVKIPQVGIVQIDDDVEVGANTTIDRARFGRTWIQEGTKIDNLVQIAHNVVIGKHCLIVAQVGISGSTRLGDYVTLAGQVGVVGHIEIGDHVVVSAKSGVSKNLAPKALYMGNPAVEAPVYRDEVAYIRRLGKLNARVQALEKQFGSERK